MGNSMDFETYLTKGLERLVAQTVRGSLSNPRGSAFLLRFAAAAKSAAKRRDEAQKAGKYAPLFLTAKVTEKCDLHCPDCAAYPCRAKVTAGDAEEWLRLFEKADRLGVSFIFMTGGEPLLRRDVIKAAGKIQNILFPIFTNGQALDERYLQLMERCRNLVPVLGIDGSKERTDARRGEGVYEKQMANMAELKDRGLLFGVCTTVTKENLEEVLSEAFIKELAGRGCKVLLYAAPAEGEAAAAFGEEGKEKLQQGLEELRPAMKNMILINWPGDLS